jgi:hypothetical protein
MRTNGYIRQHGLTIEQRNAIDLLVAGKTDTETAASVGVHRVTVTKWRLYDPWFAAELNRRRQEVWGAAADRLRAMLPKALDAIESELGCADNRLAAAVQIVKLTGLTNAPPPDGPTESEPIINALFESHLSAIDAARRASLTPDQKMAADMLANYGGDPEQRAADERAAWRAVRKELKGRLAECSPGE